MDEPEAAGPHRALRVILWICLVLLAGCSANAPVPPPPARVMISMREYRFGSAGELRPGRIVFRFLNDGLEDHEARLIQIPASLPPVRIQIRSNDHHPVKEIRTSGVLHPGESAIFAADLSRGRYGLVCFVKGPGLQPSHAFAGMTREFRI